MLKFSRLPVAILALSIAGPVLAAEPSSSTHAQTPAAIAPANPTMAPGAAVTPKNGMVDINNASASDLTALPGVTEAEAAKIVQGRPYKEPSELVSKKILPQSEFAKIKDRVTAGHPKS
jgi:DNA uptake protein ComE-like DNA-binding protein